MPDRNETTKSYTYKILLIEPSPIVRTGLSVLIEHCKEYKVISSLSSLTYYNPSRNDYYDVILINPVIINYDQRADIRALLSVNCKNLVFAISYSPYEEHLMHQYDGCIYIYDSGEQIRKKLKNALQTVKCTLKMDSNELSLRERSILTAVAKGKTNKEIADEFNLSVYTVVTHRKNISNKLGINTISGLTVYAILHKLIDVTDF